MRGEECDKLRVVKKSQGIERGQCELILKCTGEVKGESECEKSARTLNQE